MKKVIKSCEITLPRKEAILAIKSDMVVSISEAKSIYENINHIVGKSFYELNDLANITLADWCKLEWEEVYTDKEIELKEKLEKANRWFENLSDEDKEHFNTLLDLNSYLN